MADGQPKGGALAIAVVPLLIVGGAFSLPFCSAIAFSNFCCSIACAF